MKSLKKTIAIATLIISIIIPFTAISQTGPPDPPGEHGSSEDQPPAGAPIGGGLFILLGFGAVYGGKKLYDIPKEKAE